MSYNYIIGNYLSYDQSVPYVEKSAQALTEIVKALNNFASQVSAIAANDAEFKKFLLSHNSSIADIITFDDSLSEQLKTLANKVESLISEQSSLNTNFKELKDIVSKTRISCANRDSTFKDNFRSIVSYMESIIKQSQEGYQAALEEQKKENYDLRNRVFALEELVKKQSEQINQQFRLIEKRSEELTNCHILLNGLMAKQFTEKTSHSPVFETNQIDSMQVDILQRNVTSQMNKQIDVETHVKKKRTFSH